MHNSRNKKALQIVLIVLVAVLTLGIGYASITAINLIISGNATASTSQENFKVKFLKEEGITPKITSEDGGTGDIDVTSDTTATFNITGLDAAGESAVANFKVKNESNNVGAAISLSVTNSNSEYFKVTETIQDNKLQAGDETSVTVKVEMKKTPITDSVSTSITATLIASPLEDADATGGSSASKVAGEPESFSTDSWATIQKAVQNNNTSAYNVGDTKEVTINGTDYRVRIVNKTTGDHCGDNDTEYSQTACGFVVEFQDIITTMKMRDTNTNAGGYPATHVYDYLKNTLYGQLPSDLQAAIKPTRVISGHGCKKGSWNSDYTIFTCTNPENSGNNFTSTDNLYLLSGVEVFGSDAKDTSAGTTHQLEYYNNSSNSKIKQYNSSNSWWWLRSADYDDCFRFVSEYGYLLSNIAYGTNGVAPAFRIG